VKDFSGIEFGRRAQELFEKFGLIKRPNGGLEFFRTKELPLGQPAKLEVILRGLAP